LPDSREDKRGKQLPRLLFVKGISMGNFKLYRIDLDYVKYLWNFDKKVQYNEDQSDEYNKKRPYCGIVTNINGFDYYIPLEHPREEHKTLKSNIFIKKIKDGKYGLMAFNNMIPVKQQQLVPFDFDDEDSEYQKILRTQFVFVNKDKKDVIDRANKTHDKVTKEKVPFFLRVCCDFLTLEEKCDCYVKSASNDIEVEFNDPDYVMLTPEEHKKLEESLADDSGTISHEELKKELGLDEEKAG
jgi:protein AbiQ